ncbi:MAG: ComF family protein [Porphyromonadaceae bacterium]|nr:ComF family protein [Porphyromonadaceae bacterium]
MKNNPLLDLLFPRLCVLCGRRLQEHESYLCLSCMQHLPKTNIHLKEENLMEQLFRGKADIARTFAFFYTSSQDEYRNILHEIKYRGGKECARYLGDLYARDLCESHSLDDMDVLIPVPLHPSRKRQRGYNQSEWIAKGIADRTGLKIDTRHLIRSKATPSQTHLSIYDRWLNTQMIFKLLPGHDFTGKHLLLIDDIVTTGATLLACAKTLEEAHPRAISLLTLSIAR